MTKPVSGDASIGAHGSVPETTSSLGVASSRQVPNAAAARPASTVQPAFESLQGVPRAPRRAVIQPAVRRHIAPPAWDLPALRAAQEYVRELGVRFYPRDYGWIATNGADPDDIELSDACVEIEVASGAPAHRSGELLRAQLSGPVEIRHIQRGDAPSGTGHRLLAAVLCEARIVPTKIFGVIQEPTTRRIMREAGDDFAVKIADSPMVRMYANALSCMGLRPGRTVIERDRSAERDVEVLVTYVDRLSTGKRLAVGRV